MKQIKYSLILLASLFIIPACDNFHDDIQPGDDLPIDAVYQTAADLESALAGVYHVFQIDELAGFDLLLITELLSSNGHMDQPGFPDANDMDKLTMRASNFYAESTWVTAYRAINLINVILDAIPQVKDAALTTELRNQIEGECLLLRGYLYFELVRLYGQPYGDSSADGGVPIITEVVLQKEDITFPGRASVNEVYSQATTDITNAKGFLETAGNGVDKANVAAANALLARIAFQKEEYTEAGTFAQSLIDQYGFDTNTPPQAVFDETAAELLWVVAFTPADNSPGKNWFHQNSFIVEISTELKAAFESVATDAQKVAVASINGTIVDLRADPGILVTFPLISADSLYTNKYEDFATFADDTPMARMAEFVLMQAEVLARADKLDESIALLNMIRQRSLRVVDATGNELPDEQHLLLFESSDFQNADELIEAIILERRVELCFEGNYLHDLIRLKRDIKGYPYDACELRLPIPQREIDVNPNLTQNEPCY